MQPETDTLVYYGGELKALDDSGRIGGHLVLWGTPELPDITATKDYFTPETDFWAEWPTKAVVLYHHGLDATLGPRKLGDAELKADDAGVWMSAQLKLRDDYERKLFDAVKQGKMGLSSGSVSHLVRREKQPNGTHKIASWPIYEASITPTPGEPRTQAVALKTLLDDESSPAGVASASTFPDDWMTTGSGFIQRACSLAKLTVTKRTAVKSWRDALDDLLRRTEPIDRERLRQLDERAAVYAETFGTSP
jgi:phage head maturation protease